MTTMSLTLLGKLEIGQQIGLLVVNFWLLSAFFSRAAEFVQGGILRRGEPPYTNRLAAGLFAITFGGMMFRVHSLIVYMGLDPLPRIGSLVAGFILFFGYYQIIVAWRATQKGGMHGADVNYAMILCGIILLTMMLVPV